MTLEATETDEPEGEVLWLYLQFEGRSEGTHTVTLAGADTTPGRTSLIKSRHRYEQAGIDMVLFETTIADNFCYCPPCAKITTICSLRLATFEGRTGAAAHLMDDLDLINTNYPAFMQKYYYPQVPDLKIQPWRHRA